MCDISMCRNEECEKKQQCYRYRAIPDELQTFCEFKYEDGKCDYFYPIQKGMKVTL